MIINGNIEDIAVQDLEKYAFRKSTEGEILKAVVPQNTADSPLYITGDIDVSVGAGITTPVIYNSSVVLANTEYSQALPAGTKSFMIKVRDFGVTMNLSFVSGQSGTNYIQLVGTNFVMEDTNLTGVTLYFQCDTAAVTAEILAWT